MSKITRNSSTIPAVFHHPGGFRIGLVISDTALTTLTIEMVSFSRYVPVVPDQRHRHDPLNGYTLLATPWPGNSTTTFKDTWTCRVIMCWMCYSVLFHAKPIETLKRLLDFYTSKGSKNPTFPDGYVYSSILSWSFRTGKELQLNFMFKAIQHQQIGEQWHEQDSFKGWKGESISMPILLFSVPGVWSEQRLQSPESEERSRTRSLHSSAASIIMDTHG